MNPIDWHKLGVISEIIGTVVVVASLVFVGVSVRQNTSVAQAETDRYIYDVADRIWSQYAGNPAIAEIQFKLDSGQELTPREENILENINGRWLQMWEYAFDRYSEGLMSAKKWDNWNYSFADELTNPDRGLPENVWAEEYREVFGIEFAEIVDRAYESRR